MVLMAVRLCVLIQMATGGRQRVYPGGITHWMPLPEPPQEVNRG
ncbi:DUF551 domain-containing protein [Escherichia coli]